MSDSLLTPRFVVPKEIEAAVFAAVNAGAGGIVASREYEEMERKSIQAFGEAVKGIQLGRG